MTRAGVTDFDYRRVMRQMAGGVTVVSVGRGDDISGFTATSVVSVSVEPPTLLFTLNRPSSSYGVLQRQRVFAVNILAASQQSVAEAFSGVSGARGAEKFASAAWTPMATGALGLDGALASLDCIVDEIIERAENAIVIGHVRDVRAPQTASPEAALAYLRGAYWRVGE